jgi:hypothetical protein
MIFFVPFTALESLSEQEDWDLCFGKFEYDHITDDLIDFYLKNHTTNLVNLNIPWEKEKASSDYHAQRIAAIILKTNDGAEFAPIDMELSRYNRNWNMVNDGNHRIRAYQFMKKKGFYAEFSGSIELIKKLEQICLKFNT